MKITNLSKQEQIIEKPPTAVQPVNERPPIYIRTLNIFASPLKKRYEKHYRESKKHLIIDLLLVAAVIFLIVVNIRLITEKFPIENISIQFHRSNSAYINNSAPNSEASAEKTPDSEIYLNAQALYFTAEGEQLGLGPWPPKVNESSQIRIIINLKSTLHALKNVNLLITPGEETDWPNDSAVNLGQALEFKTDTRQINWQLDHLSLNDSATISFSLAIKPTTNHLGKKIVLVKNIVVSGTDVVTQNNIIKNQTSLFSPAVE
ncbi:MAG TPA: hypothetical protein PKZ16_03260 [bacterium]|nr:hypothetical protein [bacterium]HPL95647.1 hypothetical protein [bacterium]